MNEDILRFFENHTDALPLYEAFARRVTEEIDNVQIKVQKTQISFYNRHLFACVSFTAVRKKRDRPGAYIVVSIGLPERLESPRVDAAVQPYPNRWTHHLLLSDPGEVDDELLSWVKQAAAFADAK